MQVHYDAGQLPLFTNAVVTIGTFDGVHKGHRQVLHAMQQEALAIGGETVLITFFPHPRKIIRPGESLQLINTLPEKIALLEGLGLHHLVVVPFDESFASMSAGEYIEAFLVARFHPHTLIIGYDHHFGKGRAGNYALLDANKDRFGYRLKEIPKHVLHDISISSTTIRQTIKSGAVETANHLLDYSFFFDGKVIHGDKIGRTLGYPTANMEYTDPDKIRLGEGVYAVYVDAAGKRYKGMLSIGRRPTLHDTMERVEVNIFDFDNDLYGQTIRVTVEATMRGQKKYNGLEALKEALRQDKERALQILNGNDL